VGLCQHWQDLSDFVPVPKCQRHGVLDVSGAGQKLLVGLPAPCTNARFACLCHAANHRGGSTWADRIKRNQSQQISFE
jgi:hypothetical protein